MINDTKPLLPQTRSSASQHGASSRQVPADIPPAYTPAGSAYTPGLAQEAGRSYGATRNVNGYRSIPRHTYSSLKNAASSLVLPACVLAVIICLGCLIYFELNEGMCSLPKDAETRSSTSFFPPSSDLSFILRVQEGIYGNILVKDSDDWAQRNITVRISSGSRLPNLLDTISHNVRFNSRARVAEIFVHLGTNDPGERKKLLDDNCFRSDIEIHYPRPSSSSSSKGSGRLEAQVTYGEIALNFGKPLSRKPPVFESLGLATTKGVVSLSNVAVLQRTRIRTEGGSVKGSLLTPGAVDILTGQGSIAMKVHSKALEGGQGPSYLDLMMASKSGSIDLELSPSFNGHFDLTSSFSQPTIEASSWIYYTNNQTTRIAGWVSDNGWEPPYNLPRIDLHSGRQVSATIVRMFP